MVALVTPFKDTLEVDFEKLEELVAWHIEQGTDALVPCGTTGESPTLSHEEHEKVVEFVIEKAAGKIPVVAGAGSNSTLEAIRLTKSAQKAGADGVLLVAPYYNKPTQEGLYQHYKRIAEEVDIPAILYNVPGRTGVSIAPETVARLSELKNIVAIKEASGSMEQMSAIAASSDITLLSGDDSMTLPLLSIGGKGVISVVANIAPRDMKAMIAAYNDRDTEKAAECHKKLFALCKAMFIETNPIPVKTSMKLLGRLNGALRQPLWPMSEANEAKLKEALGNYGLL
jgi:4-hydroxy-tetrahydrodipicolinate synthase